MTIRRASTIAGFIAPAMMQSSSYRDHHCPKFETVVSRRFDSKPLRKGYFECYGDFSPNYLRWASMSPWRFFNNNPLGTCHVCDPSKTAKGGSASAGKEAARRFQYRFYRVENRVLAETLVIQSSTRLPWLPVPRHWVLITLRFVICTLSRLKT